MANTVLAPTIATAQPHVQAVPITLGPATATITYYYRTNLGVPGSTTDASTIPAGATVERIA